MKKICSIILIFILIIFPNVVFAFQVSANPSNVKSNKTFQFSIDLNENIYLANGHLTYDSQLFTYISSDTPNVSVQKLRDGEIAWIYTDLSNSPAGINNIKFTFKSATVINDTIGVFNVSDSIYINTNEIVYEDKDFSHNVTILAKEKLTLPATGGIGKIIFIVFGLILMIYAIFKLRD